jgi:hypothetical protein
MYGASSCVLYLSIEGAIQHLGLLSIIYLSIYLAVRLSVCLSIYLSIYLAMYRCCSHLEHRVSVKRFVSLQFLNLRQWIRPLDGGSARRKAATYTEQHKHRIDKYLCLQWDSNPRSQCLSERRQFMPQTERPL